VHEKFLPPQAGRGGPVYTGRGGRFYFEHINIRFHHLVFSFVPSLNPLLLARRRNVLKCFELQKKSVHEKIPLPKRRGVSDN
jgi:hypothetical protein